MDGVVSVGDTASVPHANHRHPTDTTRLAATRGNWKAFHSDGSGVFQEIALGAAGTVLKGNGVAAAPSFGAVSGVFSVYNVKDYAATGDGSTDDTTAIRNTIAAATADQGATIFFPAGTYRVTGTITINDNALTFRGPDAGSAIIYPTSTNVAVFQLTAGNTDITFRDLSFTAGATQVAGSSFIDTNGADNVLINRVTMIGWYYGIYIRGTSDKVTVSNAVLSTGVATNGVGIYLDNGTSKDTNIGPWVMITNSAGAKPAAGILVKASGQFTLNSCSVNNCSNGLYLYPSSGASVKNGTFTDCVFDLCGTTGVQIYTPNQASPGTVYNMSFSNCQMTNTNTAGIGNGIYLNGASNGALNGVAFVLCRVSGNGTEGIVHGFGTNVRFKDCTVAGNSVASSAAYDGISVLANISDFEIVGNRIGSAGGFSTAHRRAITIAAGTSNYYQILNNDVGGVNTPPCISDGGTGVFKNISNNVSSLPIPVMPALTTAMQSLSVAANVLTGSLIQLPVNGLMVGTRFAWEIVLIKTAAGTATWQVQVKFGTAGTTADAAIASWTSGTNTAAIDQTRLRIVCEILTLGAAATARCNAFYSNTLTSTTGLGRIVGAPTSTATFNSSASPAYIHIGVTPGASAVMTSMCEAQIIGSCR
jgi:parallel beta-helix repeat protein